MEIKKSLEEKIGGLNRKIELCHSEWETYKTYASSCIKKCKHFLSEIGEENGNGRIENMLDELFSL